MPSSALPRSISSKAWPSKVVSKSTGLREGSEADSSILYLGLSSVDASRMHLQTRLRDTVMDQPLGRSEQPDNNWIKGMMSQLYGYRLWLPLHCCMLLSC